MDESHSPKSSVEEEFQSTLRSAPSFEIYNKTHEGLDDDDNDPEHVLQRSALIRQSLEADEFSFRKKKMDLIEEGENESDLSTGVQKLSVEEEDAAEPASPPMYLAAGLGVDGTGSVGEVFPDKPTLDDIFSPNLEESEDLEEYYKRKVDEYPNHPLILKKYAQLLQSKGELQGAEEYFSCATLADPNDGETLMQYALLVWERHHDRDKAVIYFERAAQAAPEDSHVMAAYARFLWETEDDENEGGNDETQNDMEEQKAVPVKSSIEESDPVRLFSLVAAGKEIDAANITVADCSEDSNVVDYLKKMIDENPNNPLFLKKYAQFLFQSKRDLQAAEDYYSRAISADPSDGEMITEYAKLKWELHHDQEEALRLFEQALQATPKDSIYLLSLGNRRWGKLKFKAEPRDLLLENAMTVATFQHRLLGQVQINAIVKGE